MSWLAQRCWCELRRRHPRIVVAALGALRRFDRRLALRCDRPGARACRRRYVAGDRRAEVRR